MVNLARLCTFKNHRYRGSLLGRNKVLLQCRNGKQRRNGNVVFVNITVRQNDDICALLVFLVNLKEQVRNSLFKACVFIIGYRNNGCLKTGNIHILNLKHIRVGKNRIVNLKHVAVLRLFNKNITVTAEMNACIGYNFLTNRVKRRICNLCEKLLEVVKQRIVSL